MNATPQHLRILFYKFYRLFSFYRLVSLKYPFAETVEEVPTSFASDLKTFSEDLLNQLELEGNGPVKLFGEQSLILNDAKVVWLDEKSKMKDLFITQTEFDFFSKAFFTQLMQCYRTTFRG